MGNLIQNKIDKNYKDNYISLDNKQIQEIRETYKIIDVNCLDRNLVNSKMYGDNYFEKSPKKKDIINNMLDYYLMHGDKEIYKITDYFCNEKEKVCICNIYAENFRKKYQKKINNLVLINIANFKFNKGQDRVLKIVEKLKFKNFSLFFIGNNIKKNFYYYLLKIKIYFILKKNISSEIRILNNINTKDTLSAYIECDYFIHGSRIECSPLVMFETFAAGKIYLGTDVGNVKEILKKKGLGYCSNVLNNITNKLDYYISKNLHHNKISKKKIKIFHSKNFDWNILLKKYKKIYLEKD